MTNFSENFTLVLSILTVLSLLFSAVLLFAVLSRSAVAMRIKEFLGPKALGIAFVITLGVVFGSLTYSNVIGFAPCELCWVQRIFLYPQMIIYAIALWKNDRSVALYGIALSAIAAAVALYQSYIQLAGGGGLLPCTADGAECARVYFLEWGFVTLPFMSFAASITLLLLMILLRQSSRTKFS